MDLRKIKSFRRLGLALLCAGVGLGLLSGGLEVAAQEITVCASGCDFSTIQQAIDAAPAGADDHRSGRELPGESDHSQQGRSDA